MLNIILFLCIGTLFQVGILHLWFDSYLFLPLQKYLINIRDDETLGSKRRMLAYALTCWQCFGIWVGWIISLLLSIFMSESPVGWCNIPMILLLGIGIGLLSEVVEYFVISKLRGEYDVP